MAVRYRNYDELPPRLRLLVGSTLLLRPKQWLKNLLVFAALLFSANLHHPSAVIPSVWAFVAFCLISGGVYAINDICDEEEDRKHPKKRRRPLAARVISRQQAWAVATACLAMGGGVSVTLGYPFALVALSYFLLVVIYSLWLKHVVIVDLLAVALGFVLRAVAGAVAIGVIISPWLLICTFFLAILITLGRRRHELVLLDATRASHRRVLEHYSVQFIDQLLTITTAMTLITYTLYTVRTNDSPYLVLSLPLAIYGVFRYLYLIHLKGMGGSPEDVLLRDGALLLAVAGWVVICAVAIYWL